MIRNWTLGRKGRNSLPPVGGTLEVNELRASGVQPSPQDRLQILLNLSNWSRVWSKTWDWGWGGGGDWELCERTPGLARGGEGACLSKLKVFPSLTWLLFSLQPCKMSRLGLNLLVKMGTRFSKWKRWGQPGHRWRSCLKNNKETSKNNEKKKEGGREGGQSSFSTGCHKEPFFLKQTQFPKVSRS